MCVLQYFTDSRGMTFQIGQLFSIYRHGNLNVQTRVNSATEIICENLFFVCTFNSTACVSKL